MWDSTIHLGDVISFVGLGVTLIALHSSNVRRMAKIEGKVNLIYRWFENHVVFKGGRIQVRPEEESNDR